MSSIQEFSGAFRFLSNFYPAPFFWRGFAWENSEAAYQAAKSVDLADWAALQKMTAGQAKKYGRTLSLRSDWEAIKFSVMAEICAEKFRQNPSLLASLKGTGFAYLEEGNTWGDREWGVCPPGSGNGKNMLGLVLMALRSTL